MLRVSRLRRLRAVLATQRQISTEDACALLAVSRETVRRDFLTLEQEGIARRVHGGAESVSNEPEPPLQNRLTEQVEEKKAIGKAAASLLKPGQTIFIDAGTTTLWAAEALALIPQLRIITNSLDIAHKLGQQQRAMASLQRQIILLGGELDEKFMATTGPQVVTEIYRYQADIAMLSPTGLDTRMGASSFWDHEAAIARAMVTRAEQLILLADHSKLGVRSRVSFATTDEVTILVTDQQAAQRKNFDPLSKAFARYILA